MGIGFLVGRWRGSKNRRSKHFQFNPSSIYSKLIRCIASQSIYMKIGSNPLLNSIYKCILVKTDYILVRKSR